jgi:hypothetical protein
MAALFSCSLVSRRDDLSFQHLLAAKRPLKNRAAEPNKPIHPGQLEHIEEGEAISSTAIPFCQDIEHFRRRRILPCGGTIRSVSPYGTNQKTLEDVTNTPVNQMIVDRARKTGLPRVTLH